MKNTRPLLLESDFPALQRDALTTLQINLGYLCNLSCTHCHVNAGPTRTEMMDLKTVNLVLRFIEHNNIKIIDLTGGSPEMSPHFRYLVEQARELRCRIMDRCNPTILVAPGYQGLADFMADNEIEVIASLPCYSEVNVDRQRGKGVFTDSVAGLQKLNLLGYGKRGSGLVLNLVYNPDEPVLPPQQKDLEDEYRQVLRSQFGIEFNSLFVLANMPISRFGARLLAKNQYVDYMTLLRDSFCEKNLATVMCRTLISVDYQGYVYDCDFNQMLDMPMGLTQASRPHLRDLIESSWDDCAINVGDHCYGCTAGQGSSCGGALS